MISETMKDAQADLTDLRMVLGEKTLQPKAQALTGQERALGYLKANAGVLQALGPSMFSAVLAAAGPAYFDITRSGRAMLSAAFRGAEERNAETPDVSWDEARSHLSCADSVSGLFAVLAGGGADDVILLVTALCIAAKLIDDDDLRVHLPQPVSPTPQDAPAENEGGQTAVPATKALTVRQVCDQLLNPRVRIEDQGRALLALPIPSRAMALAAAFERVMDGVSAEAADDAAERAGRRLERLLEETGRDQSATLAVMIEAGDIHAVLSMVRGEAGSYSSTAEHLTSELVEELYRTDPDMNNPERRSGRLLTITYTLIVETDPRCEGINGFFATRFGEWILSAILAASSRARDSGADETADQILRVAETDREIRIPLLGEVESEPDEEYEGLVDENEDDSSDEDVDEDLDEEADDEEGEEE